MRLPGGCSMDGVTVAAAAAATAGGYESDVSEATVSNRKRARGEAAEAVAAAVSSLQGAVRVWLLPENPAVVDGIGGDDAITVCMECVVQETDRTEQQSAQHHGGGARAAMAAAAAQPAWKRLKAILPAGNPQQPPMLVRAAGQLLPSDRAEGGKLLQDSAGAVSTVAGAPGVGSAGGAAGVQETGGEGTVLRQQQLLLSGSAWDELLLVTGEQPVRDLAGAAKHWCAAVKAVVSAQQL
jgi:hypothetical protein